MNIKIRLETEKDFRKVEILTRESFWNVYKPGCDEHLMVHNLRKTDDYIKELAFIACDGEKIVGSIVYSKSKVVDKKSEEFEVLCMGPISVHPEYQGKGIGTLMMNHSVKVAKKLNYKAVIIFGNPKYYHRFGCKNAKEFNIQTSSGSNFEEFMALELYEGSLNGITGKYYFSEIFEIDENELKEFEKNFDYKEKN